MRNIILSISSMIMLVFVVVLASSVLKMSEKEIERKSKTSLNINSEVKSDVITSYDNQESSFSSHLPIVILETHGQTISKEAAVWCTVEVVDNKDSMNHLKDKYDFQTAATIKYRGNSSMRFDKKQYHLEFFKESGGEKNNNISVMGMAKESDWVLNGSFSDRTLIRNSLLYGVSRQIMDWAPDTRYCEMFLDGTYQGVYLMIETIKASKGRINLRGENLICGETPYILQRERAGSKTNVINTFGTYFGKTNYELSIKYPSEEKIIETEKKWIQKDVSEFERVLYSENFDDEKNGYSKYIDVDSFVDYYVINEFGMIKDAGYFSTIAYKQLGGKFKMTVWDFDNSFNNYVESIQVNEFCVRNNWFGRLLQDRKFTEKVVKRYHELRKGVLSESNLLKNIDDTVMGLGDAIDRNFQVWGYTFTTKSLLDDKNGVSRDPAGYKEAITMLKKEIVDRGSFLDKNIEMLYQYSIN